MLPRKESERKCLTEKICLDIDMRVWDLVYSEAFDKAANDTPVLYADGSLGYVGLGGFAQFLDERKTVFLKEEGKVLTKKQILGEPLLILDNELRISVCGIFESINTQGCLVVKEDCGIVIKERDLV